MQIINKTPINSEMLYYVLTGKIGFDIETESKTINAIRKAGVDITLVSRNDAMKDEEAIYADILFQDYSKLDNYHKYIKLRPEDVKLFEKRVKGFKKANK